MRGQISSEQQTKNKQTLIKSYHKEIQQLWLSITDNQYYDKAQTVWESDYTSLFHGSDLTNSLVTHGTLKTFYLLTTKNTYSFFLHFEFIF